MSHHLSTTLMIFFNFTFQTAYLRCLLSKALWGHSKSLLNVSSQRMHTRLLLTRHWLKAIWTKGCRTNQNTNYPGAQQRQLRDVNTAAQDPWNWCDSLAKKPNERVYRRRNSKQHTGTEWVWSIKFIPKVRKKTTSEANGKEPRNTDRWATIGNEKHDP